MRFASIILAICGTGLAGFAENNDSDVSGAVVNGTSADTARVIHSFGANVRGAYVLSSSNNLLFEDEIVPLKDDSGTSGSTIHSAASFHAQYSFRYTSATRTGRLYPEVYQGVGMGVTTFFNNAAIGTPVMLYAFQGAPIHSLTPRLKLNYEWNFGISGGWRKAHMDQEPDCNIYVGSNFNAYINLGFMLSYRLSDALTLNGGVEVTHFSDGNTAYPNPGVNTFGARVGLMYALGDKKKVPEPLSPLPVEDVRPHWSYDILAYGAVAKKAVTIDDERVPAPAKYALAGISFAPMRTVNRYFRFGPSLDLKYDRGTNLQSHLDPESTKDNVMIYKPPTHEMLMAGLSGRAELVMPIFTVNLGLGYNLLCVSSARKFYQVANLRIHPFGSKIAVDRGNALSRLWLNVGYQFHSFSHPDNLLLGLGFTIN